MNKPLLHKAINYFVASIWLINGLYCKILNGVPRHKEIVSKLLGSANAEQITVLIGIGEVLMSIWIISGFKSRLNAKLQIIIIGIMNLLEFFLAPELLLWGRMNLLFALLLITVIYYNEFYLVEDTVQ